MIMSKTNLPKILLLSLAWFLISGPFQLFCAPAGGGDKTVIYLFHGSRKCKSCLLLEKNTQLTLNKYFAPQLKAGKLEFRSVNVETPENRHYIDDYGIFSLSLVAASYQNQKQLKWKNLSQVGSYLFDEEKFSRALKLEIDKFQAK